MAHPFTMSHEAVFPRIEPFLVLVLAMLALVIMGVVAEEETADSQALIIGGLVIGVIGVLSLPFFFTRRRWRVTDAGLSVDKRLWFLPRILAKDGLIPWDSIVRVERQWLGLREAVRVVGQGGSAEMILPGDSPIVTEIRSRAGGLPLVESAGLWAGPFGLLLLAGCTVAAGFIAAAAGMMVYEGETPTGTSASKGVVLALALPFICAYCLYLAARRALRVRQSRRTAP